MIKAKRPTQVSIGYRGKIYKIYDAFPSKVGANSAASVARKRAYKGAVVVDLGSAAGRLRYAVFTR